MIYYAKEIQPYVQHFGVLGMRWGHRKNNSSPSNFSMRRQIKKQRKELVKNRYLLSDTELNKQISRLQRENTLKSLARQDESKVKRAVGNFVSRNGRTLIDNFVQYNAKKGINYAGKKVCKKAFKKLFNKDIGNITLMKMKD